jgi:catechol 2,3-dioxygenase-like lactoylglutathione lyase family enzyme
MLATQKIVGFIPTTNFEQAKSFYVGRLGLGYRSEDSFALELDANGIRVRIAKIPDFKPAAFTIFGWEVQDIHQVVTGLNNKGIVFERYDFLEQDAAGIWTAPGGDKVAWFKDPDGNILSLSEHVKG